VSWTWPERAAVTLASIILAVALIALAAGYFSSNDPATVGDSGGNSLSALHYTDQGDALLSPGSKHPHYDSNPPTSGPHVPTALPKPWKPISDDALLTALSRGDIVLLYPKGAPPAGLRALVNRLASPYSRALAAAGQAIIAAPRGGVSGLVAVAWTRMLRLSGLDATALREFTGQWLGDGSGSTAARGALPGN
jgi:Protein of unknown function (DUF3105)